MRKPNTMKRIREDHDNKFQKIVVMLSPIFQEWTETNDHHFIPDDIVQKMTELAMSDQFKTHEEAKNALYSMMAFYEASQELAP